MIARRSGTRVRVLMLGWLFLLRVAAPGAPGAPGPQPSPCCFVRVGYQGTCVVQPAEGETCESILEYLNTAGTVGKTYCGSSRLRGGWSAADCPKPGTTQNRPR